MTWYHHSKLILYVKSSFPDGSDGKESTCNAGDTGSNPGWEGTLEKEMAIHSSVVAWRIPSTEETAGLQSTGSQKGGHDWAANTFHFHLDCTFHGFWKVYENIVISYRVISVPWKFSILCLFISSCFWHLSLFISGSCCS